MNDLTAMIRTRLREVADPSIAPGQQAYMKSQLPFLGVRVPVVRTTVRALAKSEKDAETLRTVALLLWREATHREERYAAQAVMGLRPVRGELSSVVVHEEMIRTGAWWDYVDEAAHRLRETLDAEPGFAETVRAWARDGDLWIRRAAIISQLGRADRVDRALLEAVLAPNLSDGEFFIRKAVGWALRDLARTDPAWVRAYVSAHDLSALSRREALKHL